MTKMCPPSHHFCGFVATQALGHMKHVMYTQLKKPADKV